MRLPNACRAGLGVMILASMSQGHAAVAYDESISGDLSGSGLAPTLASLALGSNTVSGATGNPGAGTDRDYFTITVPVGLQFSKLVLLPGTSVSGGASFLGFEAGPKITLPTNAGDATGLLGWIHYSGSDIGSDLFGTMSFPLGGSSGFTVPLGAGQYSFRVQDFGGGVPGYGFDLQLTAAAVPEPGTVFGLLAGLGVVAG